MIPKWKENRAASLAMLVLVAFLVMFLWAKTSLAVRETRQVGRAEPVEHVITVEGVGKALATPDIASISFSVETRGAETAAVQDKNTTTMNALLEKVKALGIESEDIQTSNYSVYQDFRYDPQTGQSTPTGWIVSQQVSIKVRDTANTSAVLKTVGQNGATNVSGPNFAIDNPSILLSQARAKAIADAQKNAVDLAKQLGVRLERVVGYSEYTPGGSPFPYFNKAEGLGGGDMASPNIQLGQNEVNLNVSIVYKLAD